jgi:hypothetical protein
VALTVGIVSNMVATGGSGTSLGAMAIAAGYVIGSTLIPEAWYRRRFGVEGISLTGAVAVAIALTMTGGPESPYLLLSMGPPVFATLYGGLRSGFTTGALSGALLVLITLAQDRPIIDAAPGVALYLVFVLRSHSLCANSSLARLTRLGTIARRSCRLLACSIFVISLIAKR